MLTYLNESNSIIDMKIKCSFVWMNPIVLLTWKIISQNKPHWKQSEFESLDKIWKRPTWYKVWGIESSKFWAHGQVHSKKDL